MAIEIVDFPIEHVILHSYVNVYQRVVICFEPMVHLFLCWDHQFDIVQLTMLIDEYLPRYQLAGVSPNIIRGVNL